jgi:hypothetical protein
MDAHNIFEEILDHQTKANARFDQINLRFDQIYIRLKKIEDQQSSEAKMDEKDKKTPVDKLFNLNSGIIITSTIVAFILLAIGTVGTFIFKNISN